MLSPSTTSSRGRESIARTSSNPGSRAASREMAASAANVSDPVLARYLAIKRELDRSGYTTPSATTWPAPAGTSIRGYPAATAPSVAAELQYSQSKDPRSVLLHSPPPSTSNTPASTSNSSAAQSRGGAHSGAAGSSSGGGAAGTPGPGHVMALSDRLTARLEARSQRQQAALQHTSSADAPSVLRDDHRREWYADLRPVTGSSTPSSATAQGDRMHLPVPQRQEYLFSGSSADDSDVGDRRDVERLARSTAESELAKQRAEQLLKERDEEILHLRQQRVQHQSQQQQQQQQQSLSAGAPLLLGTQQRQLQGRVEALEKLVAEKDERLDAEVQRGLTLERRSLELARQVESLQLTVQHASAPSTARDQRAAEVEQLRAQLEDLKRQLREERLHVVELSNTREDKTLELERQLVEAREAQHAALRRVSELEADLRARSAANESHHDAMRAMEKSLEDRNRRLEELQQQLKEATTKHETIKVLSAQEAIVNDELRYENDRFKTMSMQLREELAVDEQKRRQLESVIADLRADVESKASIERQLRSALQDREQALLELDGVRAALEDANRKWREAREEAETIPSLVDGLNRTRQQLLEQSSAAEKATIAGDDLRRDVTRLKTVLREGEDREERLVQELASTAEKLATAERLVAEKEATIAQLQDVMTTYDRLREAIDEKTRYVVQQQEIITDLRRQNAELDHDVETLLGVKKQVDELAAERQHLLDTISRLEDEVGQGHRETASVQAKLRDREGEIRDLRELIAELEREASRSQRVAHERDAVELKLRTAMQDVASLADELARERHAKEDVVVRVAAREERLAEYAAREKTMEETITNLHRELAQSQVEQGRLSVMVDGNAREFSRLQNEIAHRTSIAEQVTGELAAVRKELHQARLDIHTAATRERVEADRATNLGDQLHAALADAEKLKQEVRRLEDEHRKRDETITTLNAHVERDKTLARRLEDCESALRRRDGELRETATELAAAREKLRDAVAEAANVAKAESRYAEQKGLAERHALALEELEREDAKKQRLLSERDRELVRLRERLAAAISEQEADRGRRRQLEERLRELEAECQRVSILDGQVAGLQLVIAQRTKDLDEERASNADLRAKLRAGASERSTSLRAPIPAESSEAKLVALREEQVRHAQDEKRHLQAKLDAALDELRVSEARREDLRREIRRSAEERERTESLLMPVVVKPESKRDSSVRDEPRREGSLSSTVASGVMQKTGTSLPATPFASDELARTRDALRAAEEDRARLRSELDAQSHELAVASDNMVTLRQRLSDQREAVSSAQEHRFESGGPTGAVGGAVAALGTTIAASWDANTADQTIAEWRERRRRHMEQEQAAVAAYDAQVRARMPPAGSSTVLL